MTYEQYRCWILNNYPGLGVGPHIDLLAGSVAGGTAVLCTYPLDLARTKLAYQVYDVFSVLFMKNKYPPPFCVPICSNLSVHAYYLLHIHSRYNQFLVQQIYSVKHSEVDWLYLFLDLFYTSNCLSSCGTDY